MSWTHALCERCWVEERATDEGVPIPNRVTTSEKAEQCCECGFPTWAGIFVRRDPTTVRYPRPDEDESA